MSDIDYLNAHSDDEAVVAVMAYPVRDLDWNGAAIDEFWREARSQLSPGMAMMGGPRAGPVADGTALITFTFTVDQVPLPFEHVVDWLRDHPLVRVVEIDRFGIAGGGNAEHEHAVAVYTALLDAWNRQDASAFAALFTPAGQVTGFDGSQMKGPPDIARELDAIFGQHKTAQYVAKVREVRHLAPSVILLRAIVGMIPPGSTTLKPEVNAIQSVVLVNDPAPSSLRIALLQNTPAAFHGRPELVTAMTEELTRVHERGILVARDD